MILVIDILIALVLIVSGLLCYAKDMLWQSLTLLIIGGIWLTWVIKIWEKK